MRLIDADALNYVRVRIYHEDETIGGYNAIVPSSEIKNAPTVDAVPVIRCRDCKYYREYAGVVDGCCHMAEWYKRYQYPDDFCSRAERKE